jgi:hypothetical protein
MAKKKGRRANSRRPRQYRGSPYGTLFATFCYRHRQKCSVSCNSSEKRFGSCPQRLDSVPNVCPCRVGKSVSLMGYFDGMKAKPGIPKSFTWFMFFWNCVCLAVAEFYRGDYVSEETECRKARRCAPPIESQPSHSPPMSRTWWRNSITEQTTRNLDISRVADQVSCGTIYVTLIPILDMRRNAYLQMTTSSNDSRR